MTHAVPLEPPIEAYSAPELLSLYEAAITDGKRDVADFYARCYSALTKGDAFRDWQDARREQRDAQFDYEREAEAQGVTVQDLTRPR